MARPMTNTKTKTTQCTRLQKDQQTNTKTRGFIVASETYTPLLHVSLSGYKMKSQSLKIFSLNYCNKPDNTIVGQGQQTNLQTNKQTN